MNVLLSSRENTRIAVIGLGHVGLPLAVAFGRPFRTSGFDINAKRVGELNGTTTIPSRHPGTGCAKCSAWGSWMIPRR